MGRRRYEILLPLRFNDGQPVPDELFGETLLELRKQFERSLRKRRSFAESGTEKKLFTATNLNRIFVDVLDDVSTREFFVAYKQTLKTRFKQIEIWITTYPIEVL
jgi:hypothetical protein